MELLIVLLPLLGFFSGMLLGRLIGSWAASITTFFVFISFILSCNLLFNCIKESILIKVTLGSWINVDSLNVEWSFCFDSLTIIMLVVVLSISALVHLYSIEYMNGDPHIIRFMCYLSLFTFFMLILVTASNFLQMFVGWEGVGLSSYLLINFWFTRIQANKSAIKAMLVNRVGDFFILLSIFLIYFVFNTLNYDIVFNLSGEFTDYSINISIFQIPIIDLICLFIFLGAMGKSAQVGLHVWLPDAMEGPTPVSALIHAATMVTAGIFLIGRCSFLFENSPYILNIVAIVGSLTVFFAATTSLFQNDIKKVIAYSTCSQLGYMTFACGLSSYDVGIFHLFNHAFFKALLFLGAGSIIHALSNEQDMRKMGGLKKLLPFSYTAVLIGSLALIGFPYLSGFHSKDILLEVAYAKNNALGLFSNFLGTITTFVTAFYSTRVILLVFLTNPNGNKNSTLNVHESSWRLSFPLFVLCILSISIGFLTKDMLIGFGTDFWSSSIYVAPENYLIVEVDFINFKLAPFIFTMLGIFSAIYTYIFNIDKYFTIKMSKNFKIIYNFFNRKWYFDKLYNQFISKNVLFYGYIYSYKEFDRGVLEIFGPYKLVDILKNIYLKIKDFQSANIFHYLFMLFIFIILLISLSLLIITLKLYSVILLFTVLFICFITIGNLTHKL